MVLHFAAIAKLNFIFGSHGLSPILAALIWPFLIKLAFSTRLVHQDFNDLVHGSRLFLFQLQQIVESEARGGAEVEAEPRWQRAVRLVYRRATQTRAASGSSEEEDALHTLSMIAL